MPYKIIQRDIDRQHEWAVASATSSLEDENDALVNTIVALVRRSYSENAIMTDAQEIFADEINNGLFNIEHLLAAVRRGLPDPDAEGNKPPQLTTYRSQTAEMVAKAGLSVAYSIEYPVAPQEGVANPNQPILGFDGWGLRRTDADTYTLVLIQVKATDDPKSPPDQANILAKECQNIPCDIDKLCRTLTMMVRMMRRDHLQLNVYRMLEGLGRGELPEMHIAPSIVRGTVAVQMNDLQPCRDAADDFHPATARGLVVSIGVALTPFGECVMRKARSTA